MGGPSFAATFRSVAGGPGSAARAARRLSRGSLPLRRADAAGNAVDEQGYSEVQTYNTIPSVAPPVPTVTATSTATAGRKLRPRFQRTQLLAMQHAGAQPAPVCSIRTAR